MADSLPSIQADREIVIIRMFNAPRDRVWQVWTDPAHIAQWWGKGFYYPRD